MLLRTKLFGSFAGGVALSALICFVAWHGMTTMEGRSQQAVLLEDASVALLRAKVAQLRFLYTGNREEVGLTRDFITKSRDLLARAASHSISRDEAERLQTMSAKEEEFAGLFERLVEQTDAITTQDEGVADIVRAVYTSMDALRAHLETELATAYSPQGFKAYTALGTARVLFEQARTSMWRYRAFLPNAETSAAATKAIESASAAMQQVERQAEDPETTRLVAVIRNDVQRYHDVFEKMLALRETQQSNLSNIHGFILGIIDDMVGESVRAGNSLAQSQTTARVQLLGLTAGVALLGLMMALLLTRSVMNQLGKDPGELADIARRVTEGDTSAAMTTCHGSDCRGVFKILVDMVRSLVTHLETAKRESEHAREESDRALKAVAEAEAMRKQAETARQDGMQEAVSSLNSIVYVVNSAADSLASQLHAAEQGSAMQSDRINETADSMDQMNIAMLQVAKNAAMAAEVSTNMRDKAESGSRIMESAMEGIKAVSTQSLAVRESMAALNESLGAIDQILAVISDIADQTNLLALNAAIEAARAGESGRGFAVVADEVRKLAEKTMASTTDVANVIRSIRQSAEANMRQVDASVAHIQKATGLVNQSGGVLKEIATLVDNTADQVRAIAAASEEQSATTESINHSMAQVNSIAVDTTHSMHEAEQAVHALAEQAQALMGLIKKMDKSA